MRNSWSREERPTLDKNDTQRSCASSRRHTHALINIHRVVVVLNVFCSKARRPSEAACQPPPPEGLIYTSISLSFSSLEAPLAYPMRSTDVYFTTEECEGPSGSQTRRQLSYLVWTPCQKKWTVLKGFVWIWPEGKYLFFFFFFTCWEAEFRVKIHPQVRPQ